MERRAQPPFGVALVLLVVASTAGKCMAFWKPCTADNGHVLDLTVNTPCNKERYILQKGTNVTFNVEFWPTVDSGCVKAQAYGLVMGVPIPLKMPNDDGCKNSGIECPVKSGEKYMYVQEIEVKPSYPKMSATIRWSLGDESGGTMACAVLPVDIVD
uniref:MD-2-related lipid-recognition domain-containing protein n=1 Tax=Amblyomma maculatum TaxID=34609 RepID=G3MLH4_AMBMU